MKYLFKAGVLCSSLALFSVPSSAQDSDIRFGVGMGALYSGLGANVARVTDDDSFTFGVGWISRSSWSGNAYGVGFSYQRADLIGVRPYEPNRHALGIYLGAVGSQTTFEWENGWWRNTGNKPVWGGGVGYYFYQHGIRHRGFTAGLNLTYGRRDQYDTTDIGINIGYRF